MNCCFKSNSKCTYRIALSTFENVVLCFLAIRAYNCIITIFLFSDSSSSSITSNNAVTQYLKPRICVFIPISFNNCFAILFIISVSFGFIFSFISFSIVPFPLSINFKGFFCAYFPLCE